MNNNMFFKPVRNKHEYIVQSGDSLYSIALKNDVTVEELMKANNLTDYLIYPDQVLIIPTKHTPDGIYFEEYKIKYNDTLSKISNEYNVSVDEILKYNDINKMKLAINQIITIPRTTKKYKIVEGETIVDILQNTNMTCYELLKANEKEWLAVGKEINVK